MSSPDFNVEIKESSRELTKRERVKMKYTTNAIKIDDVTKDGEFVIKPCMYCVLAIHNPKSKDRPDYTNLIILDDAGTKYITGSPSFLTAFFDIWKEMGDEDDWEIVCYKRDSKNYNGKQFLTCSIL